MPSHPYQHTVASHVYGFRDLKDLMAKATPLRSGDMLAGVRAITDPSKGGDRGAGDLARYATDFVRDLQDPAEGAAALRGFAKVFSFLWPWAINSRWRSLSFSKSSRRFSSPVCY